MTKRSNTINGAAYSIGVDPDVLASVLPYLRGEAGERGEADKVLANKVKELEDECKRLRTERDFYKQISESSKSLSVEADKFIAALRMDENGKSFLTRPAGDPSLSNLHATHRLERAAEELSKRLSIVDDFVV